MGVTGDAQKLARDFGGLACAGAVCLSEMANQRLRGRGQLPERWSLARAGPVADSCVRRRSWARMCRHQVPVIRVKLAPLCKLTRESATLAL